MKKILFVANVDKEHILKFHVPTIQKFVEKGWQVDVACAGEEDIPFITNRYYMKWKRNPFTLNIFSEIKKLKHIIQSNQYDIIYCHTPTGGLASRLAAKGIRKTGTKVVYFAHGFHFYHGAPLLNWLLYYPVEKYLSKYTDLIITLNDEDYKLAKRHFSKKTHVFLSHGVGVDLSKFENVNSLKERENYRNEFGIEDDTICLGYVAEIIKNKNQIMLVKCLNELNSLHIKTKVLLVGPDQTRGRFKKWLEKRNLNNDVICTGWRSDVNKILSAFDFCTPSSIREGLGLNLIEAMKKGIPVVANDNRGHRTIVHNKTNGMLVRNNNYKEMAKYIVLLLKDPRLKESIIKNAMNDVDCYEQRLVVEQLYSEISKLSK